MSVVKVKGCTTASPEAYQKYISSDKSLIFLNATEDRSEDFSIELSLGDGWNDNYSDADVGLRRINGEIVLGRRGSIVVEVAEEISVPYNKYGLVLPTGSLFLTHGVLAPTAKVEPAFNGTLKIRLFNTTNNKVVLKKGCKLGSVIFFDTDCTIPQVKKTRRSDISVVPSSRLSILTSWLASNKIVWIGWVITTLSAWLLSFVTYLVYYGPSLSKNTSGSEVHAQANTPKVDVNNGSH
ncbi:hypothetical protein [Pseudomonas syringae]|uniref:hypothetical protein n=1 Tax=Pseudomonas syringae TaxID=317 RepID=UPI0009AFCCBE|nr:hypothetical protein [Pseudomonas syringae]